eukprot:2071150-Prymnesium_polylepis.2
MQCSRPPLVLDLCVGPRTSRSAEARADFLVPDSICTQLYNPYMYAWPRLRLGPRLAATALGLATL